MNDVTQILCAIEQGEPHAAEQLLPIVYDELRKLAAAKLAHEKPGNSLQATALVHEAYLRLVNVGKHQTWDNRGHFFAAAAEAMRRLLVEQVRRNNRLKRGGVWRQIPLDAAELQIQPFAEDLFALDEAITRLTAQDPIKAEVVKLRYFAGLKMPEIALALDLSLTTVERHWTYARAWLYAELADPDQ